MKQDMLENLRQMRSGCDSRLKELDRERASVALEARDIDLMIERVECLPDDPTILPKSGTITEQVTRHVFQILTDCGPLHRKELFRRVREAGVYFESENQLNAFGAYLTKDPRFTSDGRGTWRLANAEDQPDGVEANEDDGDKEKWGVAHLSVVR